MYEVQQWTGERYAGLSVGEVALRILLHTEKLDAKKNKSASTCKLCCLVPGCYGEGGG